MGAGQTTLDRKAHTPHGPGLGAPADTTHAANHGGKTPCAHAPHQAAPTYTRAQAAAPVAGHAPTGNADPTATHTTPKATKPSAKPYSPATPSAFTAATVADHNPDRKS